MQVGYPESKVHLLCMKNQPMYTGYKIITIDRASKTSRAQGLAVAPMAALHRGECRLSIAGSW